MVSRNESLLNSILRTNVSEGLVLKLRVIVSEDSGRRVWTNQVGDKGMSNSLCGLVAKRSKNNKQTEVVDTN